MKCRLGLWLTHQVNSNCWWEWRRRRSGRVRNCFSLKIHSCAAKIFANTPYINRFSSSRLPTFSEVFLSFISNAACQPPWFYLFFLVYRCWVILVQHQLLSRFYFPVCFQTLTLTLLSRKQRAKHCCPLAFSTNSPTYSY